MTILLSKMRITLFLLFLLLPIVSNAQKTSMMQDIKDLIKEYKVKLNEKTTGEKDNDFIGKFIVDSENKLNIYFANNKYCVVTEYDGTKTLGIYKSAIIKIIFQWPYYLTNIKTQAHL